MKNIVNPEQADDETLWHLLREGERDALKIIYQRYYAPLLNYGLKYTPDKELLKDCIHDLFVHLYHNKHISMGNVSVRAYLMKALKNNLYNKIVDSGREGASLDVYHFEIPTDEDLFECMFPKNDHDFALAQQLLKALTQLSEHQKSVLYLRYVKELSHKEIAAIMGINEQSSMNLSNRALLKLRSLMKVHVTVWEIIILLTQYRHFL